MCHIKNKNQMGFTLIELMMVIAIIGILTSIAFPAFTRYSVKARATPNIVSALRPIQLAIEQYTQLNKALPSGYTNLPNLGSGTESDSCIGLVKTAKLSAFPAPAVADTPGSTVTLTNTFYTNGDNPNPACGDPATSLIVPSDLSNKTVVLTGTINAKGVVKWAVDPTASSVVAKYLPNIN